MIKSYITIDEARLLYPNLDDYEPEQIQIALDASFSLVNSFLDATIKIPAIDNAGGIPYILKIHQAKFFQYVLEGTNIGYSDELKNLYDATAAQLKQITVNELIVSEIQTTSVEIGWNVVDYKSAAGKVYVDGTPPPYNYSLNFKCITGGYPQETKWDVYRSDSDEVFVTVNGSFEWTSVENTGLLFRLDGQFVIDDGFTVQGIPDTKNIVSAKPIIKQSTIQY